MFLKVAYVSLSMEVMAAHSLAVFWRLYRLSKNSQRSRASQSVLTACNSCWILLKHMGPMLTLHFMLFLDQAVIFSARFPWSLTLMSSTRSLFLRIISTLFGFYLSKRIWSQSPADSRESRTSQAHFLWLSASASFANENPGSSLELPIVAQNAAENCALKRRVWGDK